jgi:hypothetical protein
MPCCRDNTLDEKIVVLAEGAGMRGINREQTGMFSYISAERRVPRDHPLRPLRAVKTVASHTGSSILMPTNQRTNPGSTFWVYLANSAGGSTRRVSRTSARLDRTT